MSQTGVFPPPRPNEACRHSHGPSLRILEDAGNRLIIEACVIHAGRTQNHTIYPEEELAKAFKTFVTPYRKPVLRHHEMWTDAVGRTLEARFVGSCIHNRPAIVVTAEIVDPDAVKKVRDGRYQQISIGSHADEVYCSICGNNFIKDESIWEHEHWRGQEYDGQIAGWVLRGITFDEWSFVNQPADVNAGVIRVDAGQPTVAVPAPIAVTQAKGQAPAAHDKGGNAKGMDPDKLQGQLAEAQQTIARLTEQNEALTKEVETLRESVRTLESQLKEANEKAEGLSKSVAELQQANEALTGDIRQLLAERLTDYKIALGQLGMNEREEAVKGFAGRSLESLRDSVNDLLIEWKKLAKELPQVAKPGLAAKEQSGVVIVDEAKADDSNAKSTNPFVLLLGGLRSRK